LLWFYEKWQELFYAILNGENIIKNTKISQYYPRVLCHFRNIDIIDVIMWCTNLLWPLQEYLGTFLTALQWNQ